MKYVVFFARLYCVEIWLADYNLQFSPGWDGVHEWFYLVSTTPILQPRWH